MAGYGTVGNKNYSNGKRCKSAILRALARRSDANADEGLFEAAQKLVSLALDGDKWAIDHIADRMDGRPMQGLIHTGDEEGGPVKIDKIERVIVNAPKTTD